jgi:type IV pilus assembly protein PilY1
MKRTIIALLAVIGLWMPFGLGDTGAQSISNSTYSAVPPFANQNATPNVLILLDNSGSMGRRANCEFSTGSDGDACPTFNETTLYGGLFDPMTCYTYDSGADTRFEVPAGATVKTALNTPCAATEWDGNFLNWVTLRRIDMAKVALIGGSCAVARDAAGLCPPYGTPSKITIKAASQFAFSSGGSMTTPRVLTAAGGGGANSAVGRVPTAVQVTGSGSGTPNQLYFHVMGTDGGAGPLIGSFCVNDDNNRPSPDSESSCTADNGGGFTEQQFVIRVTKDTEPTGVIQEVGAQVRFGLMKFLGVSYFSDGVSNEGGQVEVPVGSRQWKAWNGSAVTTYANNTVAMVAAIDASYNQGNTPMAETLYEAARYFAQIGSAFHTGVYVYPNSFSTTGLGATGPGSLGPGEETVLTGSDTCTSGYGYTSNACGRDPYFLGSNHAPMWASPSTQAPCCESFVIIFTDGDSQQDGSVPAALQDLAHAYHNSQHCTGTDPSSPAAPVNGTCNTHPATPTATLMMEHKTDFANSGTHYLDDVAYWMHTRDLRQGTVPDIGVAGHDLLGKQNVTVYSFFAFAQMTNREFLLNTAKQGGFEDLDNDNVPDCDTVVLTNPCEWDRLNNATGAAGRDNIPDTYFESSDVAEMKTKLAQALSSILQRSTSGTSLSVLATSTTGEGALYQSFFFPKVTEGLVNVYWIGYTQALFLDTFGNLREDSDGDGRLVYKNDKIIKTRYNSGTGAVDVDLFTDTSPSPDGDGQADSTTPTATIALKDIKPIWEAGKKLAERDEATLPRNIQTWLDIDNDGVVDSGEQYAFTTANEARLRPYLRGANSTEGTNIITWIRGGTVTGYRNRELTVGGATKTWRYGDTIHSTPTVVGAPRERFDVLYGDLSYSAFFQAYKDRRQVAYVGANDGMLHAFNVGFYNPGDDPTTTTTVERGWFTTQRVTAPFVTNTPAAGHELWAFIPQELLPQLKFLTQGDYQHVYYVDQKPKITDARIFCDGSTGAPTTPNCVNGQGSGTTHPNGWGTILIGSFRLGGSCANCNNGATNLSVTADFNYDGDTVDADDTRSFRSAYFALDITDPELDPKLLWTFTDSNLGLTLGYPTMVRLRPDGGDKTENSDARWFMVTGSGPTGYDVGSVQTGRIYVVDIVKSATTARTLGSTYYTFATPNTCGAASPNSECSLFGNAVTVDADFDYRADILYFGNMICNATTAPCNGNQGSGTPAAPAWKGKLYRLTLASSTNPALGTETDPCGWGIGTGCTRTPTVLLGDFACTGSCTGANLVGPVSAAVNVAQDDANKMWVYWGTGRYFANADKTNADTQYFFGVKDLVPTSGCTQTTATDCEEKDLLNVSNAEVCVIGTSTGTGTCDPTSQVTGVTGVDSFDSSSGSSNTLVGAIQNKDGWYTTLPDSRERSLSQPAIIGGLVFFPTFVPTNDLCSSSGSSFLYALYYKSGTANKESVIGTETVGSNTNVKRRAGLGDPGLASGVAVHMGAQGSGANGSGGGGCQGQLTANIQSSTGSIGQTCLKTTGVPWSYILSWVGQRE